MDLNPFDLAESLVDFLGVPGRWLVCLLAGVLAGVLVAWGWPHLPGWVPVAVGLGVFALALLVSR